METGKGEAVAFSRRHRGLRVAGHDPGHADLSDVLWLVAAWAFVGGVFLVIFSFKVKGLGGRLDELKQKLAGRAQEPGAAA